jgi:chromosome segregation ATPase
MYGKLIIGFVAALFLTSCASTNPREGGFIGGLQGIFSGAYDARVQKSQQELSDQERLNQSLEEESRSLDAEVRSRDILLATEQDHLAGLQKNISKLESNTGLLVAKSDVQKVEIARLKRQIEDHRSQLKSLRFAIRDLDQAGGSVSNPGRYQVLKRERDRLETEYRRLHEYSLALSKAAN